MHSLLFTNTFFEEELLSPASLSLYTWLERHPVYLHLSYLSCLVSTQEEIPLLPFPPETIFWRSLQEYGFPATSYKLLSDPIPPHTQLHSWGASASLAAWSKEKGCLYNIPPFGAAFQSNSKSFSFLHSPRLEGSSLIETKQDLLSWWTSCKGPKILKTLQGSAGRGHFLSLQESEDPVLALAFYEKNHSSPLIAEPWVDRVIDFSSQWIIPQDGLPYCLGVTLCENSPRGTYKGTIVGPVAQLFAGPKDFLEEHLFLVQELLPKIQALGFFGHLGVDAMLYRSSQNGKLRLHPIVEINARKTMGWAALQIAKNLRVQDCLRISYTTKKTGLLPSRIETKKGKFLSFPLQLSLEKIDPQNLSLTQICNE